MNYKELLTTAIKATIVAGKEVLNQYENGFKTEYKTDNSPVTSADLAAHTILMNHLSATELPIISEEGNWYTHEKRDVFEAYWVLDPIDGTRDFVNKTDEFCICTGLVVNKTAKLGVLYAPALDLFFFGAEGIPSHKFTGKLDELLGLLEEENLLSVLMEKSKLLPSLPAKEKFTFLSSRYHKDNKTKEYIEKIKLKHPDLEVVTMGCAIKMGMIADRYATEYTRFLSVNFWDIAAGHAIAKYAGLKVTNADDDEEITYTDENMKIHGYSVKWTH